MGKSKFIKKVQMARADAVDYAPNVSDQKHKRNFINKVKKLVRGSMEYKDYILFLRENMDMDSCAFFNQVTSNVSNNADNKKIKIEVHHEPFTIDDIVATVLEKAIDEGTTIDPQDIAEEVMRLHYNNQVGLIPLSITIHEVVHSGTKKIIIPLYMCYGEYTKFIEAYEPYLDKLGLLNKIKRKIEETKSIKPGDFAALTKQFEYLEVEGREDDLHKVEEQTVEVELAMAA